MVGSDITCGDKALQTTVKPLVGWLQLKRPNGTGSGSGLKLLGVLFKFEKALFGFLISLIPPALAGTEKVLLINTRLDRWFTWTEREVLSLRRLRNNPSRARKQGGNDSQEWGGGVWPQAWR